MNYSGKIERLSGYLESFGISSTGNSLFVTFDTDLWDNHAGFLATIHYGNIHLNIK